MYTHKKMVVNHLLLLGESFQSLSFYALFDCWMNEWSWGGTVLENAFLKILSAFTAINFRHLWLWFSMVWGFLCGWFRQTTNGTMRHSKSKTHTKRNAGITWIIKHSCQRWFVWSKTITNLLHWFRAIGFEFHSLPFLALNCYTIHNNSFEMRFI